jgi:hypothetical protein
MQAGDSSGAESSGVHLDYIMQLFLPLQPNLKSTIMADNSPAIAFAGLIVAGAIWWAQRDRTVSISSGLHLGRKEDELKQDIKDLKAELKSLKEETKAEARKRDADARKRDADARKRDADARKRDADARKVDARKVEAEARKRDAELQAKLDKLLEKTGTLERVVKLLWLYYLTYFLVQGDLFGTFALQVARSLLLEVCK